jgi:hypothetical protein
MAVILGVGKPGNVQFLFLSKLPLYLSVVWTNLCYLTITISYCDLASHFSSELSCREMISDVALRKSEFAAEQDKCYENAGTSS